MKQVVQYVSGGRTVLEELPNPSAGHAQVLVAVAASLISAGTERYVVDLARKNIVQKAMARPDDVKRVLQKIRSEGFANTVSQVRAKLDEGMPLGYSASGVVVSCGRDVQEFKPGDRIAVAAPHASLVTASPTLCAAIPDHLTFEEAAYTSVAAIALQGVRLARLTLGENVLVVGLGLIGQITVALLKAQGCRVYGLDPDAERLDLARTMGLDEGSTAAAPDAVRRFSGGYGVDAAIITASTASNEPIEFSAEACRQKGRIVLVGVAGLQLPRAPFFAKELEFTVSSSLGPGRGDPQYEEKGIDYPIGHARWTAKRNMEAVLALMAAGRLPVDKLTTHRFAIEHVPAAYDLIARRTEPHLGIVLRYPAADSRPAARRLDLAVPRSDRGMVGISLIGAGNFARLVLMPALARHHDVSFQGICTARGLNAVHTGEKYAFRFATTDVDHLLRDESTSAVAIATRHDTHADLVIRALRAGKHVFVEKPLCISDGQLQRIAECVESLGRDRRCPMLVVGWNRRFSPAVRAIREHFSGVRPLSVTYRFAAADLPSTAWPQDPEVGGGRIVGEACHAIDTCAAIVDSPPVRVFAESVAKSGGAQTNDDRVFITLRHANGSISSISYQAAGDRSGPTERIEVFGDGRTATIEGWDAIEMWAGNRRTRASGHKDKGHANELRAFVDACRTGGGWPVPWEQLYATTWASLAAVQSLRTGLPINIDDPLE